jgi:tRNA/rRNA methyltransferase
MMKPRLEHFSIVLNKPRFPENIGSAARAARNMGISHLILVDPENPDKERMRHLATRMGADIIKSIKIYDELTEAVADFGHVVGTTARTGGVRSSVKSPRSIAPYLAGLSENNRIALVFGPEDRGLTNHEIRLCHTLVTIPTSSFSSLNLSHAVMIVCYELFTTGMPKGLPQIPKLADSKEMECMYDRLKKILIEIDFIKDDNPDYRMMKIRRSFARAHLTSRDAATILGICRQIKWRINNLSKTQGTGKKDWGIEN